jgi:hypothetical protein
LLAGEALRVGSPGDDDLPLEVVGVFVGDPPEDVRHRPLARADLVVIDLDGDVPRSPELGALPAPPEQ